MDPVFDALVVGGGPAGLSAALLLARCRRGVMLVDSGRPRNGAARRLHGFLTRDGVPPRELLRLGRAEVEGYGVAVHDGEVVGGACEPDGTFAITLADGSTLRGRALLLATGVRDELPPIPGLEELYGTSVHHCPFCDGWEHRDEPIAVHGRGPAGLALATKLANWSPDVVLLTDGPAEYDEEDLARLAAAGVELREERVEALEGEDGCLQRVRLAGAEPLARSALFFASGQQPSSDLAEQLGCETTRGGKVETNRLEGTNVPGLYVAGDAAWDVQLAIVAAAEGAKAAVAIHDYLGGPGRRDG